MNKKIIAILLMLLCAACLCLGQLVWKLMPDYKIVYLLGGFAIYIAGAILMIFAYRFGELSVLQPINSMSYVFAAFLAVFILHEKIPTINIIGIVLIVSGVIIIGVNSK